MMRRKPEAAGLARKVRERRKRDGDERWPTRRERRMSDMDL